MVKKKIRTESSEGYEIILVKRVSVIDEELSAWISSIAVSTFNIISSIRDDKDMDAVFWYAIDCAQNHRRSGNISAAIADIISLLDWFGEYSPIDEIETHIKGNAAAEEAFSDYFFIQADLLAEAIEEEAKIEIEEAEETPEENAFVKAFNDIRGGLDDMQTDVNEFKGQNSNADDSPAESCVSLGQEGDFYE